MTEAMTTTDRQAHLRNLLEKAAPKMAEVLPRHMDAEKLVRIVALATSRTPALLECHPVSVLTSVMVAARLGLEPDGVLGSAYLVPFWNSKAGRKECQLIPGYRGLIDLARRSGDVRKVEAHLVYPVDRFEVNYGAELPVYHIPEFQGERGDWYAVYALATMDGGVGHVEVMTRDEVLAIKSRSKSKGGPWQTDFDEMARKTVVRRLAKYLPLSPELAAASLLQAGAESGDNTVQEVARSLEVDIVDDDEPASTVSQADAIADQLGAPQLPAPEGPPDDVWCTAETWCVREDGHAGDCDPGDTD